MDDLILDNAWIDALIRLLVVVGAMTGTVLMLIWIERKWLGRIQMRLGPMRTGPYGLLQSGADAIKLVTKEDFRPASADRWVFELAPYVVFVPVFIGLIVLPFTEDWGVRNMELALFYLIAVSGISFVGFLMAGWASDNKYALLGALRATAQLFSYEVPFILAVVGVVMVTGTLNLNAIALEQDTRPLILVQPLGFLFFLTAALAEMNRTPFDMAVGESELVGGPMVEYSGIRWGIFFLGEYTALWATSVLASLVFFGGWNWPGGDDIGFPLQLALTMGKSFILILLVMTLRAALPRLRIDQLMSFAWKILIPVSLAQIILNGLVLVYDWPEELISVFSFALVGVTVVAIRYAIVNTHRVALRALERRLAT
jgi:NADH-quinone oxidoreductase subunit H